MSAAKIRRIITRPGGSPRSANSTSNLRSHNSHSGDGAEHLASLLGVSAVFTCEENEFMRDKTMQYMTLGLMGKRGISEGWNLADTQVGTVWKPRVLMVSTSMVMLFGTKKGEEAMAASPDKVNHTQSSPGAVGGASPMADGDLIQRAGELKTTLAMEDISHACEFIDPKGSGDHIVQIRTTSVTGVLKTALIRMRCNEEMNLLLDALEKGLKGYRVAVNLLKAGKLDEDGYRAHTKFNLSVLGKKNGSGECCIISDKPEIGEMMKAHGVSQSSPLLLYLAGPEGSTYCARIVPYQLQLAATNQGESSIRADVLSPGKTPDFSNKPLCLFIEAKKLETRANKEDAAGANDESSDQATPASALVFAIKETSIVITVCVTVALALAAPDSWYQRGNVLALLALPVAMAMLAVRGKAGHKVVLGKNAAADAAGSEPSAEEDSVSYALRVTRIKEGLEADTMSPEDTLKSYKDRHSTDRKLSALAVAGAYGGVSTRNMSSGHEDGISGLISALEGAHDDSLTDADCPQKWYDACDGKEKDAIRQWRDSLAWRRELDVDNILSKPLPHFFTIKEIFPHAWIGLDNDGNLTTVEQFGNVKQNVKDLLAAGITADDFANHCVWLNEYWIKNKVTKTGRLNKIIDLKGLSLMQITPTVKNYFQPMNHCMQQYPELLINVIIINAPSSFTYIWRMISVFLAKKTTDKIKVCAHAAGVEEIVKKCPAGILMPDYGGTYTGPFKEIPIEVSTARFIRALNKNHGIESKDDWAPEDLGAPTPTHTAPATQSALDASSQDAQGANSEPAEALLQQLVGKWTSIPKESDDMTPLLTLMGKTWLQKSMVKTFESSQNIQVTGLGNNKTIEITSVTGPVTMTAKGEIGGSAGAIDDKNGGQVSVKIGSPPASIKDVALADTVQLEFDLPSGDKRVVHHSICREDKNKKVMNIEYTRTKDGEKASVTIFSRRG